MKALGVIWGVLMCILGFCAMSMPFRTFLGIGWLVGAIFLVYGVQMVIESLKKEKKDVWGCVFGVLAAVLGIWITFSGVQRLLTDLTITYMIGFGIILNGVSDIIRGSRVYKSGEKKSGVIMIILGVLSLIAGILAVGHPFITMASVGLIIACSLFVQGVSMIVIALTAKKEA